MNLCTYLSLPMYIYIYIYIYMHQSFTLTVERSAKTLHSLSSPARDVYLRQYHCHAFEE